MNDSRARVAFADAWAAGGARTVTGEVMRIVADDFAAHQSTASLSIRDERTGERFTLWFEQAPPANLRSGTRAQFTGRVYDSELLVAACCSTTIATSTTTTDAATPSVSGDQRTLVMIANFRDAAVSCTLDAINNAMFADPNGLSVSALYSASSLGAVSISGQVTGPYVLNAASTDTCDISGWADAADAAAAASGVDITAYPRRMYVMPPNTCPGAGLGTIGSPESSRAWVFDCATKGVFAHEFGHNLGMDHASTPTQEYGDTTDPMALASWMLPGVNAPHRHELGWVQPADIPFITASGTYNVAPLAIDPASASAPRALMLSKPDTNDRYYLSYRTPIGFDRYSDGTYTYQLSVHQYKGDGSVARTFLLAGLSDGRTFTDSVNGISITLLSHDDAHASVQVNFATACVAVAPTLSITPQLQTAAAGTAVSYTVAVTNHDGPACGSRTFSVTDVVPQGWISTVTPLSVTATPGATAQAVVTLTSPSTAAAATYAATITAADSLTTGASGTASYTVQLPPDTAAPTAPSSLTATVNSKRKEIDLSWKPSSDDRSVAGYRVIRNGAVVSASSTTTWIDPAWTSGATYTYSVVAYDTAGNVSASSNTVTVTIGGGGGGSKKH